jgi:CBS domain-containing protein
LTIAPDDNIMQAAKVMVDNRVRALTVVQNADLLGVFTLQNLAQENQALAVIVLSWAIKPQVGRDVKA